MKAPSAFSRVVTGLVLLGIVQTGCLASADGPEEEVADSERAVGEDECNRNHTDTLRMPVPGEEHRIQRGHSLWSCNGRYELRLRPEDGILVIYAYPSEPNNPPQALWATDNDRGDNTWGPGDP